MKSVLVISASVDPATDVVVDYLNEFHVPWTRLNLDMFGPALSASWEVAPGDRQSALEFVSMDQRCTYSDVGAVWYRRPATPPPVPDSLSKQEAAFLRREIVVFWRGIFASMSHLPWVDDWRSSNASKLEQLEAARDVGLTVPKTLVSNNPHAIRQFVAEHHGEVIGKPVSYGQVGNPPESETPWADGESAYLSAACFTDRVTTDDLEDSVGLSLAPVIYQSYVPKKLELRVTVVGSRIFSASIDSMEAVRSGRCEAAFYDWRRLSSIDMDVSHKEHPLSRELESQILQLMKRLNLAFGCVDFILTPEDDCVFLEVNPFGQWGWIETKTGLPITQNLARLLQGLANGTITDLLSF